jgi:hypothetical protein
MCSPRSFFSTRRTERLLRRVDVDRDGVVRDRPRLGPHLGRVEVADLPVVDLVMSSRGLATWLAFALIVT